MLEKKEISCADCVRNEVLHGVKEDRTSLCEVKRRKANWMDHILGMNSRLKDVTEGMIVGRVGVT